MLFIETLRRFNASALSWPLPETLTDTALEEHLFPKSQKPQENIPLPDISFIQSEMLRPHVTLQRLFEEYKAANPNGISRSSFFRYVSKNQPVEVTMRQHHKGGQTLYSDYSGNSLPYTDPETCRDVS